MFLDTAEDWSQKTVDDVFTLLRTTRQGLSSEEVQKRQEQLGKNKIKEKKHFQHLRLFLKQFKNPIVFIFLIAGVLVYLVDANVHPDNHSIDAYIIFGTLIANIVIGFFQEERTFLAFQKIQELDKRSTSVERDKTVVSIPFEDVTIGDVVVLRAGMRIPADIRLIEEQGLKVNESILTGEWAPISKNTVALVSKKMLAEQVNMLWRGTTVVSGFGKGVVVAIGEKTKTGELALSLQGPEGKTPLRKQTDELAKLITILVGLSVLFIVLLAYFKDIDLYTTLVIAVAVAVAGVPSGLPAVITVVLALGMHSITKQGGLVRNLLAVETLGSTTWILTDKTGTLTEGKMRLVELVGLEGRDRVGENLSEGAKRIIRGIYLASNGTQETSEKGITFTGTPVEKAFVYACEKYCKGGIPKRTTERLFYFPFSSALRYSAAVVEHTTGMKRYYSVGAPEVLLEHAHAVQVGSRIEQITSQRKKQIQELLTQEAAKGRRVLGLSVANDVSDLSEITEGDLAMEKRKTTFLTLLSLEDPLRKEVAGAITYIKDARVRVSMVTGDNAETALQIAKEAGIVEKEVSQDIVLGSDFIDYSDEEIYAKAQSVAIFARMLPQQKLRLLRILSEQGEVVAMTGDGINDAPALHRASIGVALASGTDVAKEASDLILLKNSFSTITKTIIEGRKIIGNLKKILVYLLSTSFSEAILVGVGLLFVAGLPILPAQILWANVVEELFIAFALAFERESPDAKYLDPRERSNTNIINTKVKRAIVYLAVATGIFLSVLYLMLYYFTSLTEAQIQTTMFIAVSLDSILLALSLKQLNKSLFKTNIFDNPWLLVAMFISASLLFLALVYNPLSELLSIEQLPLWVYSLFLIAAVFHISFVELVKKLLFFKEFKMKPMLAAM